MLIASPASCHAPLAPRPVGDVCPVLLLHFFGAGQLGVLGLRQGLDVVGARDIDLTLGCHLIQWRKEALLTILGRGGWCTVLTGTGS